MTSPVEAFVVELGRVSQRGSRYLRGLSRDDRDDVIAGALLSAWETRETYDQKTALEDWFSAHLREARRSLKRTDAFVSVERLAELVAPNNTEREVQMQEAATRFIETLEETEQEVVERLMGGERWRTIVTELGVSGQRVKALNSKLRYLHDYLPNAVHAPKGPVGHRESDEAAPIDHEIERMLRRGATTTADCPVCWRCSWFEGLLPAHYHPTALAEAEVSEAVRAVEARKIEIANEVRA